VSLPRIAPYPMPVSVPPGRATWEIDPDRCVVLVHDAQRYFLDAFAPGSEPVTVLLDHLEQVVGAAREQGVPVVYSAQPGDQAPGPRGLLKDFWGPGLRAVPEHTDVVDRVAPRPGDVQVTKWRYSAFQRTDLRERLAELGRDQVVVTGVYAHLGCLLTAADAFMRDLETFFVADAVADFSEAEHHAALAYAAGRCARVLLTADVLACLGGARA
jgi:bifunctional isochorismate lyase / aryl carrier protein